MKSSLKDKLKISSVLAPATVTADGSSTGVDVADFGAVTFVVHVGAFDFATANKLRLVLRHADTDSAGSYSDVGSDDMYSNAETGSYYKDLDASADDAGTTHLLHYRGNKRYVKVGWVETGTVSVAMGIVAVRGDSELKPPL